MKALLSIAVLTMSLSSFAACHGEAQMMPSKIVKIVKTQNSVRAFVKSLNLQDNPLCPLDDSSIMSEGIEIGQSSLDVGSELSGILVNTDKGIELTR